MEETRKELNERQMEKVTGGALDPYDRVNQRTRIDRTPHCIDRTPHCKECGGEMANVGGMYRCLSAGCEECGKDKNAGEVIWK